VSIIDNIDEAYVYAGDIAYKTFKAQDWAAAGVDFNRDVQSGIDAAYTENNSWLDRLDDVKGFYKDLSLFILQRFAALPKAQELAATYSYAGGDDADPITFTENVKEQVEVIADDIEKVAEAAGKGAEFFADNPKTVLMGAALLIGGGLFAAKKAKLI
jgi:hypothetical protein